MIGKSFIKLFFVIIIFALILSLTACGRGEASDRQTSSGTVESLCNITPDKIGQHIKVAGSLCHIELGDSQGIFAEIEDDGSHIGVWINREEWESWPKETQALVDKGIIVIAEGELKSFEGNLLIDVSVPLIPADIKLSNNGNDTKVANSGSGSLDLDLVSEPLKEKRLNVEKVFSGGDEPGLCYLGAYAMIAKYADSNIDFTDIISNCGIATSAFYIPEINLLLNGFEIGSIAVAAENQGFDYYIAALEGAQLTDQFLAENLVESADRIIYRDSEDEIFRLLKKLISSDIPVMVHLDINYIRVSLIEHCPYWEEIFSWQDTNMSSTHIDHYMSVNGYDENYVYINDPTEKEEGLGKDIPVNINDFIDAWKNGNHPSLAEESHIGPYWMLFLGERGKVISTSDLISWNKSIATEAIPEIRKAAENPNISELIHCNGMYRARKEFGVFLERNNLEEAGDIFLEISQLFRNLNKSSDQQSDMLKIADLQEKSLSDW